MTHTHTGRDTGNGRGGGGHPAYKSLRRGSRFLPSLPSPVVFVRKVGKMWSMPASASTTHLCICRPNVEESDLTTHESRDNRHDPDAQFVYCFVSFPLRARESARSTGCTACPHQISFPFKFQSQQARAYCLLQSCLRESESPKPRAWCTVRTVHTLTARYMSK